MSDGVAAERVAVDTDGMERVFAAQPASLSETPTSYCFGCTYGIIARIFAEAIDELGIAKECILVAGNGCAGHLWLEIDGVRAPHGRAPAVASALKRLYPDKVVFTVQGDGDLCSEGVSEAVNAAWRGERISLFWFNNSSIAMTGAQMSPTSVLGMQTSTTPDGRDAQEHGFPMKMTETLALSPGVTYAARTSVHDPANVARAKKAIKQAFENQRAGEGMSVLEILTTCNSGWKMTPIEAIEWLQDEMLPVYPVEEIKRPAAVGSGSKAGVKGG